MRPPETSTSAPAGPTTTIPPKVVRKANIAPQIGEPVGRIEIPRIHVDKIVVQGDDVADGPTGRLGHGGEVVTVVADRDLDRLGAGIRPRFGHHLGEPRLDLAVRHSRAAADPPPWRMLPEESRRTVTSLMARLILERGCQDRGVLRREAADDV